VNISDIQRVPCRSAADNNGRDMPPDGSFEQVRESFWNGWRSGSFSLHMATHLRAGHYPDCGRDTPSYIIIAAL
jgi:hypothetical protein